MPKIQDKDKEIIARIFRDIAVGGKPLAGEAWLVAAPHYLNDIQRFLDEINKKGYDLVSISNKKGN